ALRDAYGGALPAILSSNITVVLALLTLLLATLPNYRALGASAAVGLLVALAFAVIALPAALAVCGRGLFWPFIPRPEDIGAHELHDAQAPEGIWGRIAAAVARRPVRVLISCVLLLVVLACGLFGTRVGLSQSEQFRTESESAAGLETAAQHFPAGVTDPVVVLTREGTEDDVLDAATGVEGVVEARPSGASDQGWARLSVTLDAGPATDRSEQSVTDLRDAVRGVPGSDALVGGAVAEAVDTNEGNLRDLSLLAPLILLVLLLGRAAGPAGGAAGAGPGAARGGGAAAHHAGHHPVLARGSRAGHLRHHPHTRLPGSGRGGAAVQLPVPRGAGCGLLDLPHDPGPRGGRHAPHPRCHAARGRVDRRGDHLRGDRARLGVRGARCAAAGGPHAGRCDRRARCAPRHLRRAYARGP